jgi:hypothetical protein
MIGAAEYGEATTAIYDTLDGRLSRKHCAELAASAISPDRAPFMASFGATNP